MNELERIKAAMAAGEHTDGDLAEAVEQWEAALLRLDRYEKLWREAYEPFEPKVWSVSMAARYREGVCIEELDVRHMSSMHPFMVEVEAFNRLAVQHKELSSRLGSVREKCEAGAGVAVGTSYPYGEGYRDACAHILAMVVERGSTISFEGNVADLPKYPTGPKVTGPESEAPMQWIQGAPRCLECGRYIAQHTVGDGCSISKPLPRKALKQIAAKLREVRRYMEAELRRAAAKVSGTENP